MTIFKAVFHMTDVSNCLFYREKDWIILTDRDVKLPVSRPSCLIFMREMTNLLFTLLPHAENNFQEIKNNVYNCGGCTGLIKFKLGNPPGGVPEIEEDNADVIMHGRIDAIPIAELLQVFHMHQKTGRLMLDVTGDSGGRVTFREGAIVAARHGELDNQEAVFSLLRLREGKFRFLPGLPVQLMKAREIGDFMMILMKGLKKIDEHQ
jgi:hypothetical protein